jgi:hypothetical protein
MRGKLIGFLERLEPKPRMLLIAFVIGSGFGILGFCLAWLSLRG